MNHGSIQFLAKVGITLGLVLSSRSSLAQIPDLETVRVRIEDHSVEQVSRLPYEIVGLHLKVKWQGGGFESSRNIRYLKISPSGKNLALKEQTPQGVVTLGESPWIEVVLRSRQIDGAWIEREHRWIRSTFNGEARIFRLELLSLRDYLLGVLPSEMPLAWPDEALKAQIVASSSYLISRLTERRGLRWPYDVEASVMDQRYQEKVRHSNQTKEKIGPLLNEVMRYVLWDRSQQKVMTAYFHADCGGRTEAGRRVWGQAHGKSVSCPVHRGGSWSKILSLREIVQRLRLPGLSQVKVAQLNDSGRVEHLRFESPNGQAYTISGHQFRMAMGPEKLQSARFVMSPIYQAGHISGYRFAGTGRGHGVGLCQNGAADLAKRGYNFRQILRHYYPEASLTTDVRLAEL